MTGEVFRLRYRVIRLWLSCVLQALRTAWMFSPVSQFWLLRSASDQLYISPPDIRTADSTVAQEIYSGRFAFAGISVETLGLSPFEIPPPSPEWQRALHAFGWLRHMRAAGSKLIRANTCFLINDWIRCHAGSPKPPIWDVNITAKRLIAWITHASFFLEEADDGFYQRFHTALVRQFIFLKQNASAASKGVESIQVGIALTLASNALKKQNAHKASSLNLLEKALREQILEDGGHISRNPEALVFILSDLLPLRQLLFELKVDAYRALDSSINKMQDMLEFLRLPSQDLGRFNGCKNIYTDRLATLSAYKNTKPRPPLEVKPSGFERLEAEHSSLIFECGTTPKPLFTSDHHAGCLSFEFSYQDYPVVVNCGQPYDSKSPLAFLTRTTPAHSTLCLASKSSCTFVQSPFIEKRLGRVIIEGVSNVEVLHHKNKAFSEVTATQNGYENRFGFIHRRTLRLDATGETLDGLDALDPSTRNKVRNMPYVIRFHLHPGIKILHSTPSRINFVLPNGVHFRFTASQADIETDESLFFAENAKAQETTQIVLSGESLKQPHISWKFEKTIA